MTSTGVTIRQVQDSFFIEVSVGVGVVADVVAGGVADPSNNMNPDKVHRQEMPHPYGDCVKVNKKHRHRLKMNTIAFSQHPSRGSSNLIFDLNLDVTYAQEKHQN